MFKKLLFPKKKKEDEKEVEEYVEEEIEEYEDEEDDDEGSEEEYEDDDADEDEEEDDEEENEEESTAPVSTPLKEKTWIKKDGELAVDIYETEDDIVIMAPLGGVGRDEIEIITEKDMVIIKGARERKENDEIKGFYANECFFGSFCREIILPEETDPSRIKANLENGVLTIKAPKIEREKRRKINI